MRGSASRNELAPFTRKLRNTFFPESPGRLFIVVRQGSGEKLSKNIPVTVVARRRHFPREPSTCLDKTTPRKREFRDAHATGNTINPILTNYRAARLKLMRHGGTGLDHAAVGSILIVI